ncbi:SNF2_family helicase [Hexamita inflata]|uniref:SNF2 family helicase n=1 Tax=Hexamita inflata TaxID=28002 RepID=A0AA86R5U0_9EUKA|nr:SNF2 family helicase [Hexamita inflata]
MNINHYSYRTPQEGVQQTLAISREYALQQLKEDSCRDYQQLKSIASIYGLQQLNNDQKKCVQSIDQFIQNNCQSAVDQLSRIDPNVAQYCREMKNNQQSYNTIDFNSPDYHTQLRMYVQENNASNFQQLEYKLKTLYILLVNKQYSRSSALQHLKNVLQSLDKIAQTVNNVERQHEVRVIWQSIQMISQHDETKHLELWDQQPINEDEM